MGDGGMIVWLGGCGGGFFREERIECCLFFFEWSIVVKFLLRGLFYFGVLEIGMVLIL